MTKVDVAALIALCAALASAVGDVVRQRSAHEITEKEVGHLELFGMSLRDKRWWLGGVAAIVNYSLQAAALAWGSVVLVTALQVTALLFALPIYARLTKYRVTRWEWAWAVVLAAALAVVIIVGDPRSGHERAPLSTWMIVALVMGPALVLCVLAARVWSGRPVAAVLLAVVAGSSLALFAVLTKGVVEVADFFVRDLLRGALPDHVTDRGSQRRAQRNQCRDVNFGHGDPLPAFLTSVAYDAVCTRVVRSEFPVRPVDGRRPRHPISARRPARAAPRYPPWRS